METRLLPAFDIERDAANIRAAAEALLAGLVVAFPTETVYGLGARADSPPALELLKKIKGRPEDKPFAILVPSASAAKRYSPDPPAEFERLARRFWPGPLTIVVPDGAGGTVGLRCPAHPAALEMLRIAGVGVAAPSANRSGMEPATEALQIYKEFKGEVAIILDGGPSRIGRASTVVKIWQNPPASPQKAPCNWTILRKGAISEEEIRSVIEASDSH